MATTVDRKRARILNKYFRAFQAIGWFQDNYLSLNLQSQSCEDMHYETGIYTSTSLVRFFCNNPDGETSTFKWTFRRVDQLRNLYVWAK